MFDPLAGIKSEIEEIKADVLLAVQIAILREAAATTLSRLATLDPAKATAYRCAIQTIGASAPN
jgi:hypothetical protein